MTGLLRGINRVNASLLFTCRQLVIALMGAIALIVIAGVFWRYVLNDALSWYEEVSKFAMIWMTFLGAPLVFRHGGHVAIEALPNLLPGRPRAAVHVVAHGVVLTLLAVLTWEGARLAWNARTQVALTLGDLSLIWIYLAIPVGCALMFLVGLELLLDAGRRLLGGPAAAPAEQPGDVVLPQE